MTDEPEKPILWVALSSVATKRNAEETVQQVKDDLEEAGLDEDYRIVVADEKARLLSAREILEALGVEDPGDVL